MRNPEYSLFSAVLEINFGESDYSIEEGSGELTCPITLQFRNNQNPFTVMLSPVTVFIAEGMGLGFFINSMTIDASLRATTGTQLYSNGPILSSCVFLRYHCFFHP